MAVIKWQKQAWKLFNSYVEFSREEFGEKTARHWEYEIVNFYERLKKFPTSYTPEQLLNGREKQYRGCHIMSRRFKIIYYYDETEDIATLSISGTRE